MLTVSESESSRLRLAECLKSGRVRRTQTSFSNNTSELRIRIANLMNVQLDADFKKLEAEFKDIEKRLKNANSTNSSQK